MREFIDRINAHDPSGIVALCTADHVFTDSLGSKLSGLAQLARGWSEYSSLFRDYRVEIESIISAGQLVLATGWAEDTCWPA